MSLLSVMNSSTREESRVKEGGRLVRPLLLRPRMLRRGQLSGAGGGVIRWSHTWSHTLLTSCPKAPSSQTPGIWKHIMETEGWLTD